MLDDADLMREDRPVAEVARALLAPSILRLAKIRTGRAFKVKAEALAAYEAWRKENGGD